ncbi:hypothetical protein VB711_24865 [Cronbergia sp. UHCC 0137]|uniref:hypothetical protein n=1 Tax=Cronbergia sp. UHCC 0137 TaxID=3110239 RepID=UPI002B21883D|nr:hypothetical protein [Cronbergia sp. UHCC 0137]MEA5621042.1 hypothetical protein [Cronbergia sp. UHCC 0137]
MFNSKILATSLNLQGNYPCPTCKVGKISPMPLMETMSCDFCHEIFTINVERQQIKMPSRQPPLIWRWNGFKWTENQLEGVELGWGYALGAIAFVLIPTSLIGMVAYFFPPNADDLFTWIPSVWTILTFLLHLLIIVWIFVEVYQIPIAAYLRAITRWRRRVLR